MLTWHCIAEQLVTCLINMLMNDIFNLDVEYCWLFTQMFHRWLALFYLTLLNHELDWNSNDLVQIDKTELFILALKI